ncbi:ectoine/hydroxyectoine ABC transporter permease subunit EhuC [Salinicoccus sp. ID82-1]|uniref:Ectoine/hydroxyectoine ABC transporter permease subunit EhuC n=1 Tax=Salinicoccus cyprini TaxID=2493691 RepID=A0A558AWZ5_9STAP|nr:MULTISPECIES: ectoine/hydroxyectoine ABC transporter permease subunit EhuC [Salinicoccus]MCG1010053.1 ectoine/hydroxyectoine ABC transporter permease subunit EhuC [Salinicoccus sp. ID82-1]TVT28782.1 ectoine/hydroxyectoine ABC transporter permease subunit EhuC [Salinicoccus cyprini]
MFETGVNILTYLSQGAWTTISIFLVSTLFSFIMAFVAGLMRLVKNPLVRGFTTLYVEIFRGTSLIVQLFWLYYAVPMLFNIDLGSNFWVGVIAIALNYGAYMSEVVRSSILAIDKGQTEASIALNFSGFQRMRHIILPQALRLMLPEFGNYSIQILKGTALVSLIGLTDILYYGDIYRSSNLSEGPIAYMMVLVMYFIIALPLIWLSKKGEKISRRGVAS